MTREEIKQKVLAIVDEQGLTLPAGGEITEATRFKEDLNVDSLDSAEIIMEIEDAFDLTVPAEGVTDKWLTVKDVIDHLDQRLNPPKS